MSYFFAIILKHPVCNLFPLYTVPHSAVPQPNEQTISGHNYQTNDSFIYGNVEQQLVYGKIYVEFLKLREKITKEQKL